MKAVSFGRSRGTRRRSKYGNVRTNGFASKHESEVWQKLLLLAGAGKIRGLSKQVAFPLMVNDTLVCRYIADFTWVSENGQLVIADAKGFRTREYTIKKRLLKAIHGYDIQEL